MSNNLPHSLPAESLRFSKKQMQTAFAVSIAELVVQVSVNPNGQVAEFMNLIAMCSGHLAHFTRQPEIGLEHIKVESGSMWVFVSWREVCERTAKEVEQKYGMTLAEIANGSSPTRWTDASRDYWKVIDDSIPGLLENPTLAAVRAT